MCHWEKLDVFGSAASVDDFPRGIGMAHATAVKHYKMGTWKEARYLGHL